VGARVTLASLVILAAATSAAAQTGAKPPAPVALSGTLEPPVTGSMYNGNNVQAPNLVLKGPLATTFQALESLQTYPVSPSNTPIGAHGGGASATGRATGQ
jgi:hypothetical protein